MATLAEIQQQLFCYLQSKPAALENIVVGKSKTEVARRLAIYRDSYQLRLSDNLSKQFPVLRAYLRGEAFEQLALVYLQTHPPTHFAIRNYGRQLPEFLRVSTEYAAYPYLAELAQLEWHLNEIIDQSPCQTVLTTAELAQLAPEMLASSSFQLQGYWRMQAFQFDTPPWRDALKENSKTPAPAALAAPKHYALWRKGFQTYYRCLNALEVQFVTAIQQGQCFNDLCELAAEHTVDTQADAAQTVVQTLLTWIHDGWFTSTHSSSHG